MMNPWRSYISAVFFFIGVSSSLLAFPMKRGFHQNEEIASRSNSANRETKQRTDAIPYEESRKEVLTQPISMEGEEPSSTAPFPRETDWNKKIRDNVIETQKIAAFIETANEREEAEAVFIDAKNKAMVVAPNNVKNAMTRAQEFKDLAERSDINARHIKSKAGKNTLDKEYEIYSAAQENWNKTTIAYQKVLEEISRAYFNNQEIINFINTELSVTEKRAAFWEKEGTSHNNSNNIGLTNGGNDCFINSSLQLLKALALPTTRSRMPKLSKFLNNEVRTEQDDKELRQEMASKVMRGHSEFGNVAKNILLSGSAEEQHDVTEFLNLLLAYVDAPQVKFQKMTTRRGNRCDNSIEITESILPLILSVNNESPTMQKIINNYLRDETSKEGSDIIREDLTLAETIPEVFVASINRFQFDHQIGTKRLDPIHGVLNSISLPLANGERAIYEPRSIICHVSSGEETNYGHYVCYRKEGDTWFQINDEVVTEANFEEDYKNIQENCYVISYVKTNKEENRDPQEVLRHLPNDIAKTENPPASFLTSMQKVTSFEMIPRYSDASSSCTGSEALSTLISSMNKSMNEKLLSFQEGKACVQVLKKLLGDSDKPNIGEWAESFLENKGLGIEKVTYDSEEDRNRIMARRLANNLKNRAKAFEEKNDIGERMPPDLNWEIQEKAWKRMVREAESKRLALLRAEKLEDRYKTYGEADDNAVTYNWTYNSSRLDARAKADKALADYKRAHMKYVEMNKISPKTEELKQALEIAFKKSVSKNENKETAEQTWVDLAKLEESVITAREEDKSLAIASYKRADRAVNNLWLSEIQHFEKEPRISQESSSSTNMPLNNSFPLDDALTVVLNEHFIAASKEDNDEEHYENEDNFVEIVRSPAQEYQESYQRFQKLKTNIEEKWQNKIKKKGKKALTDCLAYKEEVSRLKAIRKIAIAKIQGAASELGTLVTLSSEQKRYHSKEADKLYQKINKAFAETVNSKSPSKKKIFSTESVSSFLSALTFNKKEPEEEGSESKFRKDILRAILINERIWEEGRSNWPYLGIVLQGLENIYRQWKDSSFQNDLNILWVHAEMKSWRVSELTSWILNHDLLIYLQADIEKYNKIKENLKEAQEEWARIIKELNNPAIKSNPINGIKQLCWKGQRDHLKDEGALFDLFFPSHEQNFEHLYAQAADIITHIQNRVNTAIFHYHRSSDFMKDHNKDYQQLADQEICKFYFTKANYAKKFYGAFLTYIRAVLAVKKLNIAITDNVNQDKEAISQLSMDANLACTHAVTTYKDIYEKLTGAEKKSWEYNFTNIQNLKKIYLTLTEDRINNINSRKRKTQSAAIAEEETTSKH